MSTNKTAHQITADEFFADCNFVVLLSGKTLRKFDKDASSGKRTFDFTKATLAFEVDPKLEHGLVEIRHLPTKQLVATFHWEITTPHKLFRRTKLLVTVKASEPQVINQALWAELTGVSNG